MIDKYIYDDSFLTESEIYDVQKQIYPLNFLLALSNSIEEDVDGIHVIKSPTPDSKNFTSKTVMFYTGHKNTVNEKEVKELSTLILNKFGKKNNFKIDELFRTRSNLTTRGSDYRWAYPHVDQESKHFVFLYYVNDSDGDTILYNEVYNTKTNYENNLTELVRIKPKAGAAIVFDGSRYHSFTNPVSNDFRCVINMNFMSKDLVINNND
jgi:hypothetical protein